MPFTARDHRENELSNLLADIAAAFGVDMDIVKSGDQQGLTATVRRIFYFIGSKKYNGVYTVMVRLAGKRVHTTCIYHIRKVEHWLKNNDTEFVAIWDHYLKNSKIFTKKDFQ